ncbi:MAG TPA: beta-ketoacyl-[acyl-carrier-protein] synthase family protein [Verrucomicrobiae bacterium]|jgi:3-oxoacyl-[acyl-carrier-protein] synthase II
MREPAANIPPPVAIAGCGVICAVGCGVAALQSALRANASGLRACERFNSPRFQSSIVGAVADDFFRADEDNPAYRLAAEALRQARAGAHLVLSSISAARIGLVLATTKANIEALERLSDGRACSDSARRHLQGNLLAADLAAEFGAGGPVQCVSAACVSGLSAIQQGAKIIQRNEADAVFVVGADHLSTFVMAGFTAFKAIDPNGCRPFDKDRCGLSPGEAGAAIVLVGQASSLSSSKLQLDRQDACPTIKIRGWGTSNDANHLTGPSRDGSGLALAIRAALASAKLSATEIDYVNAHGTGTPYNDAMESLALKTIFGGACPPFSAAKGMLGHTLGAAGVIETIICVLALRENFLPGTPRLDSPADGVPENLAREPRDAHLKNVLKLNTGFGGLNGALILSHG